MYSFGQRSLLGQLLLGPSRGFTSSVTAWVLSVLPSGWRGTGIGVVGHVCQPSTVIFGSTFGVTFRGVIRARLNFLGSRHTGRWDSWWAGKPLKRNSTRLLMLRQSRFSPHLYNGRRHTVHMWKSSKLGRSVLGSLRHCTALLPIGRLRVWTVLHKLIHLLGRLRTSSWITLWGFRCLGGSGPSGTSSICQDLKGSSLKCGGRQLRASVGWSILRGLSFLCFAPGL